MYLDFYGLAEQPFNVTPDSKFLYLSRRHEEALGALIYGVEERKGFICLSGEIGSGKTTLYRTLLARLDSNRVKAAIILNPFLSDLELLKTINQEFGLPSESESKKELLDHLNEFLIEQFEKGCICVLILDEAQNLRPETLEQIRMISNLETDTDKLIQMILVGQPELRQTLALPELEQLNQRITVRHHVVPLIEEEVGEYVRHRMQVARAQVRVEFSPQAIRLLYHLSKGVPRRINVICDRCLLFGYVLGRHDIDGEMVQQAVEELRGEIKYGEKENERGTAAHTPTSGFLRALGYYAAAAVALLGIVAGGVWLGATLKEQRSLKNRESMQALLSPKPQPPNPEPEIESANDPSAPPDKKSALRAKAAKPAEIAAGTTGAETLDKGESTAASVGLTSTTQAAARPARTPIPPDPWTHDADHVVRVNRPDHAQAAAHVSLIEAWGLEVDLATFASAPADEVSRYDLPAMMHQLDFVAFSTPDLTKALMLDLPMLIRFQNPAAEFPPYAVALKMRGDLFVIADPLKGLRIVSRKELEPHIREISVAYRDPQHLTGLAAGASGDPVIELQRVLVRAGRKIDPLDGKFGSKLAEMLRSFQRENKLAPTGSLDPMTAAFISTMREPGRPRLYS